MILYTLTHIHTRTRARGHTRTHIYNIYNIHYTLYHLINTTTEISGSMLQCNSTYLILVFQYVIYPNRFILNTIINKEYDIFIGS